VRNTLGFDLSLATGGAIVSTFTGDRRHSADRETQLKGYFSSPPLWRELDTVPLVKIHDAREVVILGVDVM
jgi:hypothetical protein